jgi:hypothetical protein
VGGWLRGLDASSLVDGDVDNHRAQFHCAYHVMRDKLWSRCSRHQHGAAGGARTGS